MDLLLWDGPRGGESVRHSMKRRNGVWSLKVHPAPDLDGYFQPRTDSLAHLSLCLHQVIRNLNLCAKACLTKLTVTQSMVQGEKAWLGRYYTYRLRVYSPYSCGVETFQTTDPYSGSLAADGARTQANPMVPKPIKLTPNIKYLANTFTKA